MQDKRHKSATELPTTEATSAAASSSAPLDETLDDIVEEPVPEDAKSAYDAVKSAEKAANSMILACVRHGRSLQHDANVLSRSKKELQIHFPSLS